MCTLARSLPCPRIYGASFSGPNMLVVFDSRAAIGHGRVNAITNVLSKRKSKVYDTIGEENSDRKKQANANPEYIEGSSLPRTYGELLVSRDPRFARKNQTMTSSLSVAANLASMDLTGSSERGTDSHMDYLFGEDENDFLNAQPFRTIASTGQFSRKDASVDIPRIGVFDYTAPTDSLKKSVEGLMRYSDDYVHNAPNHQPGNPLSATNHHQTMYGLETTPHFVTRKRIVDRLSQQKRVLEAPSSSNWNLSLCVKLLDLSRLCGVTAVLMYETCLSPEAFVSHKYGDRSINDEECQHSLAQWIDDQQSSIQKHSTTWIAPKDRKGFWHNMISKSTNSAPFERVCDYNAHISTLGGRPDLCKVWTVLGSVCAAPMYFSLYEDKYDRTLKVTESWKHHPFGLPLIKRVLQMYEQVGDLPSLASLVCVLENQKEVGETTTKSAVIAPLNGSKPLPDEMMNLTVDSTRAGLLAPVEGSHQSRSFGDKWRHKLTKPNSSSSSIGSGLPVDTRMLSSFGSGASPVLSPHSPSFLSLLAMKESHPVQCPSEQLSKPFGATTSSWKLEFEKLENPFRTWSAGNRESSPPRVSAQLALRLNESTSKAPMRSKLLTPAPSPKHTLDSREKSLCLRLEIIPNNPNKALLGREPADGNRHAVYKRSYADVLYRYGAVSRRTEILKDRALMNDAHDGIHFGILCWRCQTVGYSTCNEHL
uniref:Uncharacterized protein AlNc14C282G10128 n=1 Tax=Albugo laibachii Nc14 TaxID=890382 RepID=F0WUY1_9STRA|nr:conserved hypothetical protein [Albugo laibachii Nc14]|eukprot:CCA25217.1 conserved hypothetical protein [Albugo laibachii Nc14]